MTDDTSSRKIPCAESFDAIREHLERIKREEGRAEPKKDEETSLQKTPSWGYV